VWRKPASVVDRVDVDAALAGSSTFAGRSYRSASCWRRTMPKPSKRTRMTPEEQAQWQAEYDGRTRLLEERLAYHRAKTEEERARKERRDRFLARLLPWRA
jgi:hypothetical protein